MELFSVKLLMGEKGEGRPRRESRSRAQIQEERTCLMTQLDLVTNIRNYKKTGSYRKAV